MLGGGLPPPPRESVNCRGIGTLVRAVGGRLAMGIALGLQISASALLCVACACCCFFQERERLPVLKQEALQSVFFVKIIKSLFVFLLT